MALAGEAVHCIVCAWRGGWLIWLPGCQNFEMAGRNSPYLLPQSKRRRDWGRAGFCVSESINLDARNQTSLEKFPPDTQQHIKRASDFDAVIDMMYMQIYFIVKIIHV
jgi:hypothetical protein